ncbi:MAG: DegV family protein [Clostridiales bacterium]|nr:DegV family protein [Clostridiales bacterium]
MKQEIVITADSTCDIPSYIIKRYQIEITPLTILLGNQNYRDGVDIAPDDIYSYVDQTGVLPKTAAVTPAEYGEVFRRHVEAGKAVVHINLSSAISSTYQNARIAASEFDSVYVVDSKNLCTGLGLLVLHACDLREAGRSAAQIAEELELVKGKINTSFVLDTLEYLHKGGRCSGVAKLGANLLGLKPSIVMDIAEGTLSVGKKYRGRIDQVYQSYARDRLAHPERIDRRRIVIAHSGVSQAQIDSVRQVVNEAGLFQEIIIARAGCTITSHCGPNTLAVFFMEK